MKRKRVAWTAAGLMVLAAALVSCGNMLAHTGGDQGGGGAAGSSSGGEARAGGKTVSLVVANYGEHFGGGSSRAVAGGPLRTIVGDAYNATQVKFYLWGQSTTGTPLAPREVTVTPNPNSKEGTVSVALDPGSWDLVLVALPTAAQPDDPNDPDKILEKAALRAKAHVDTLNVNTVRFTLSADGLDAVAPTVKVNITDEGDWFDDQKWKAEAGIYDLLSGNAIPGVTVPTDISSGLQNNNAAFDGTNVAPGTYAFKVVFKKKDTDAVIATWSDTIIIYPAKQMDESVVIPELVDKAPDAPTDFKVGWNQAHADAVATNMYGATFKWTRGASNNESGFELELMDIEAEAAPTDPAQMQATWQAQQATKQIVTYNSSVYGRINEWIEGSLAAANTEITLLLPMDTRYIARLRAVNDGGESDYVYVDFATPGGGLQPFEKVINLYKVRYELDGGSWTNGPQVGGSPTDNFSKFYAEKDAPDITIEMPQDPANPLKKNTENWAAWQQGNGTLYPMAAGGTTLEKYNTNKSLILTAKYGSAGGAYEWEIYDEKDYDIQDGWIDVKVQFTAGTGPTGDLTVNPQLNFAQGTVGVERTKGGSAYKVIFNLTVPNTPNAATWNYDVVGLEISRGSSIYNSQQKASAAGTPTEFEVDVSSWTAGKYQCTLVAYMGRTIVSKPITLTLADK